MTTPAIDTPPPKLMMPTKAEESPTWKQLLGTWRLNDGRTPPNRSPRFTFNADNVTRLVVLVLHNGQSASKPADFLLRLDGNILQLAPSDIWQMAGRGDEYVRE
jgi:hypothetical protein